MTPQEFKQAREQLGLTQQEMADKLRLSSGRVIRMYESGDREVSGTIILLVDLLLWLDGCPFRKEQK